MMSYDALLIVLVSVFALTVLIILLIVLNNSRKTNDLNNELSRSIFEIRSSLNQDLSDFNSAMNSRFVDFSERVNSNLIQSHKASNEVFNTINEKMVRISKAQETIDELSRDIISLQDILTDKKSRGTFGEVELYSLLESVYGNNENLYRKQYHLPNGSIADAAILADQSFGILCIDSKFPLENYRNMLDQRLDEKSRELYKRKFRDDVRKHINDIHDKYIIPDLTADLAYMFIPAEAIFALIYGSFPELVDFSYQKNVYMVSPTTLMAYITAIRSIYLGKRKDEKAREISILLSQLAVEFQRYEKRSEDLYRTYEAMGSQFHDLSVSSRKILKRFDQIEAGEFEAIEKEDHS
ncbi:MAG: DNA recombination protein RmuC [Erysipelotrichaceae bacterium]|nr:DNA recombination protein RmuC [Erysipelotrichaceae bacterium]